MKRCLHEWNREKTERKNKQGAERYSLADADGGRPCDEYPPKCGKRLSETAIHVPVAAPEDRQKGKSGTGHEKCIVHFLRGENRDNEQEAHADRK